MASCTPLCFEFSVEAMVWGYHVYQDEWVAVISEVLQCQRETGNRHDHTQWLLCAGSYWTCATKNFTSLFDIYLAWWLYLEHK